MAKKDIAKSLDDVTKKNFPGADPEANRRPRRRKAEPEPEPETLKRKVGRPPLPDEAKKDRIKFTLSLDRNLYPFLQDRHWRLQKSISDYINELIEKEYGKYVKDCVKAGIDPCEGWEKYEKP